MRQSESLLQFKPSSNFKEGEGAGWEGQNRKHNTREIIPWQVKRLLRLFFSRVLLQKICNEIGAVIIFFHILSSTTVYKVFSCVQAFLMICPSTLSVEQNSILLGVRKQSPRGVKRPQCRCQQSAKGEAGVHAF